LPERKVERIIQAVDRLEELTDVRELTSELVPD